MDKEQFRELVGKLDILTKLLAANIFQGKPLGDSILFLADLGLQNKEVAEILGTTPACVNKIKYEAKHPKKKQKRVGESKTKTEKGG